MIKKSLRAYITNNSQIFPHALMQIRTEIPLIYQASVSDTFLLPNLANCQQHERSKKYEREFNNSATSRNKTHTKKNKQH